MKDPECLLHFLLLPSPRDQEPALPRRSLHGRQLPTTPAACAVSISALNCLGASQGLDEGAFLLTQQSDFQGLNLENVTWEMH